MTVGVAVGKGVPGVNVGDGVGVGVLAGVSVGIRVLVGTPGVIPSSLELGTTVLKGVAVGLPLPSRSGSNSQADATNITIPRRETISPIRT